MDKWGIQTVLALRHSLLTQALLAVGKWRPVFAEREAVVFVRDTDANRAILDRVGPVELSEPTPEVVTALVAALAAAERGDEAEAIRQYAQILALAPDHPVALFSLGVLRAKRGESAEARALLERVIELDPGGELARQARERLGR